MSTYFPRSSQSCFVVETGLSEFCKMAVAVMKSSVQKLKLRAIVFRNYNSFCNESYRDSLTEELSEQNLKKIQ